MTARNARTASAKPATTSDLAELDALDGATTSTQTAVLDTPAEGTQPAADIPAADENGEITLPSGVKIPRADFLALFKPESLKTLAADPELGKAMKAGIKTVPGASATKNEEVRNVAASIKWGEVTLAEHPQIGFINQFSIITKTGMTQVGVTWTDKNEDGGKNGFYVSHKKLTPEAIAARVELTKVKALKQALAGLIEIN